MMNVSSTASLPQVCAAAESWRINVLTANPLVVRWRVFMHSWSPEVADTVRQRYRPWLAAAQHDRALYFRSRPNSNRHS